ncbi:MAG: acyl-CoA synthetase [Sphingomonadaceae bacterium]|nr:acyl-CoA synthetase [Sphingomonadaceae bacterium]
MHPRIHAQSTPDKPALIMAGTGEAITYRQLEARANRGAHALRQLGLGNGSTIAIVSSNRPEYFDIVWAAQRAGIELVAVSTRLKAGEIAYIVNDSGSTALLISETLSDVACDLAGKAGDMPALKHTIAIGTIAGWQSWDDLCANQPGTAIADEMAGTRMTYSSGTTGRPKGIKGARPAGEPVQENLGALMFQSFYGIGDHTAYLSPAPLYHSAPLGYCVAVQCVGGTVVVMDKFRPEAFLQAIEKYQINTAQVVPTMFIRLLALSEEERGRYDLSSLKIMIHAAAPCPIPVKRQMIEWLGPIIEEYYAGSEGNLFVKLGSEEWLSHPGSVGRAVLGTIRICSDEGDELPTDEIGTIYVSEGKPFEYHNDPEKTASSRNPKHPDWSTIGDVGRLDEDGYLYLADRKDFMIISGGVNIYPQEVENLLITHPGVDDAAVFGVPNAEFGEEVKAVVQPADFNMAGDSLAVELIGWCKGQLADVKCPRSIEFEQELPRAETGKLYKKELKARYWPARPVRNGERTT